MTTPEEHRALRELLGSLALGHLPADEALRVQAHVDGCAACRADLAELAPLAAELRRVDPALLTRPVTPPADLGARILEAVRAEQPLRARRARSLRLARALAAAAAVAGLLAVGALAEAQIRDDPAPVVAVPMEQVRLVSLEPGVVVTRSVVIPHTWGIELQMAATGLHDGTLYRGLVIGTDGSRRPAGEFVGVSGKTVKCNLQAALLRKDSRVFQVVDASGAVVMQAQLT